MHTRLTLFAGLVILGLAVVSMAATPPPPRTIAYQGRLTDTGGSPVPDGAWAVDFIIWNDPTSTAAANKMWESGALAINTVGGLFNVNLGALGQPELPDTIFVLDTNLYLGTAINGGAEQTPRTKLTSVAYSYVAGTVPDSSLYATKTINEAGLTYSSNSHSTSIPYSASGIYTDMVTVSITTPTGGFVVVEASGQFGESAGTGILNEVAYQIDQTAGGTDDPNFSYLSGNDSWTSTAYEYVPFSIQRPYYLFSPGTYTFRLEARSIASGPTNYCWSPVITATFYPTYYGLLAKSSSGGGRVDTAYVDGRVPPQPVTKPLPQHQ